MTPPSFWLRRPAAAALAAALALGACSSGSTSGPQTVVRVGQVPSLGQILTTSSGMTLYMFPPDAERQVTCTGASALSWPPLTVARAQAEAGPGVQQSLLGADPNPEGGPPVVTYDGWPLYTYRDDTAPGQTTGQGIYLNGGYWYTMAPSGQPLTTAS